MCAGRNLTSLAQSMRGGIQNSSVLGCCFSCKANKKWVWPSAGPSAISMGGTTRLLYELGDIRGKCEGECTQLFYDLYVLRHFSPCLLGTKLE